MTDPAAESRSDTVATLHQALIDQLVRAGMIHTAPVEAAFRAVPRHLFLPGVAPDEVYRDEVIRIKELDGVLVSSSSQPAMMAIMLEQLALEPGQRVLEIGAATGYNAALMAHIVGDAGSIVTLDLDEDLATQAQRNLASAGVGNVAVVCRDGWLGYAEAAPFDRIILTVAADDLAPAWYEQLGPGGRLLLPLVLRAGLQKCVAFEQRAGAWESVSLRDCGFMTLRGAHAVTSVLPSVHDAERGLTLSSDTALTVAQLAELLEGPHTDAPTGVRVSRRELWRSVVSWLALYVPRPCVVVATGAALQQGMVPGTWVAEREPTVSVAYGAASAAGVSLLHGERRHDTGTSDDGEHAVELVVRSYGTDVALAEELRAVVMRWHQAGRPTTNDLRVWAYPAGRDRRTATTEVVIDRPSSRLVLAWATPGAAEQAGGAV